MISPGISDHFKLHKQYLMSELLKFAVLVNAFIHYKYTSTVYFLFIQNAKDFFFGGGGEIYNKKPGHFF